MGVNVVMYMTNFPYIYVSHVDTAFPDYPTGSEYTSSVPST